MDLFWLTLSSSFRVIYNSCIFSSKYWFILFLYFFASSFSRLYLFISALRLCVYLLNSSNYCIVFISFCCFSWITESFYWSCISNWAMACLSSSFSAFSSSSAWLGCYDAITSLRSAFPFLSSSAWALIVSLFLASSPLRSLSSSNAFWRWYIR